MGAEEWEELWKVFLGSVTDIHETQETEKSRTILKNKFILVLIQFSGQNYLDKFRKRITLIKITLGCIPNRKATDKEQLYRIKKKIWSVYPPLPSLTSPTWSPGSISAFLSCLSLLSQSQMCGPSPVKAVDTRYYSTYFMLLTSFLVHCIFSLNAYHTYFETHRVHICLL